MVSHEEWIAARRELLEKEKAFTRQGDEISRLQRSLPWERVTKEYTFEGPDGRETLADLFAGRSQLIVYHFMFHPDDKVGCPHCQVGVVGRQRRRARYRPSDATIRELTATPDASA